MSPEMKRGPLSPQEAEELRVENIPEEVFIAFNGLIAQNLSRGRALVKQKEVMKQLTDLGMKRAEIFDKNWLDVEESYRAQGWKVTYDSPSYGDSDFDPYFEFQADKGNQH